MKNKIVKGVLLGCIMTFVIACNEKKEEPVATPVVDKAQIKTEIQGIEDAFAAAFNARNADSIATYYSDDATSFSQNKAPLVGKKAITNYLKEDVKTFPKGYKISFTTNEVHVSNDANQVVEIGAYNVVDSTGTKVNSGNFISLFEKRNGKYICVRDMGASEMPAKEKK